jgi:hypothetical protein
MPRVAKLLVEARDINRIRLQERLSNMCLIVFLAKNNEAIQKPEIYSPFHQVNQEST